MSPHMTEFISVVVPAFNRAGSLGESLQSLLGQTYPHWEAIIVDDGSGDGTAEVAAQFARRDSRIRWVKHAERRGAQAARNTGIRTARGDWIAFLDSDDVLVPDSLKLRYERAKESQADVVHSECYVLRPRSESPEVFGVPPIQGHVYKQVLSRPGPVFPAILVSRAALADIGFLDEGIIAFQEWDTVIRLAKRRVFGFVTAPTFVYDCRHSGTISKDALRGAAGYEQVVAKHRLAILRYCGPKVLAAHYETAAGLYREANALAQARRSGLRALALWPFGQRIPHRVVVRLARAAFGAGKGTGAKNGDS